MGLIYTLLDTSYAEGLKRYLSLLRRQILRIVRIEMSLSDKRSLFPKVNWFLLGCE